jgi:hypothetical protein
MRQGRKRIFQSLTMGFRSDHMKRKALRFHGIDKIVSMIVNDWRPSNREYKLFDVVHGSHFMDYSKPIRPLMGQCPRKDIMMQLEAKAREFKAQPNAQPDEKEPVRAGTDKLYPTP